MADFSENAEENPASNADGKSIAELFRTDPLELSDQDIDAIIKHYRQQRKEHAQKEHSRNKTSQKGTRQKAADNLNLDIDDI